MLNAKVASSYPKPCLPLLTRCGAAFRPPELGRHRRPKRVGLFSGKPLSLEEGHGIFSRLDVRVVDALNADACLTELPCIGVNIKCHVPPCLYHELSAGDDIEILGGPAHLKTLSIAFVGCCGGEGGGSKHGGAGRENQKSKWHSSA